MGVGRALPQKGTRDWLMSASVLRIRNIKGRMHEEEPHHLLILKENEESISMKTYELFQEATALGLGGHGMG